jgi:hypothetical protein
MREKTHLLGYLVLIFGLFLIITGFFMLVPADQRDQVTLLNLAVVCWVFLVLAVTELGLMGFAGSISSREAGLGIRLLSSRLYTLAAIALIILGMALELEFRYQLFLQLTLVFGLLIGYFFTAVSDSKAASVLDEQEQDRMGKAAIQMALSKLERVIYQDLPRYAAEQQQVERLKEMARFLSPTNNEHARAIDAEAAKLITRAAQVLPEAGAALALLNQCEQLLILRKNTYAN